MISSPRPISSRDPGRGLFGLLAPTWILLGVFFVLPLGAILIISLAKGDSLGGFEPITSIRRHVLSGDFLANYMRSLKGPYLMIFWRSIWVAIFTTVLCLIISYPIAYYIAVAAPARLKTLLLILVVVPFWTSFLIRTYA